MTRTVELDTGVGPARAAVETPSGAVRGRLVLGHGAGGGIDAPDLLAARDAAVAGGWSVARVEQPYRVAGRRSPPPAARLDVAWVAAVQALREPGLRLVSGGRSSGARVACRTASAVGADGVLCLAFPLEPPGGRSSRLGELAAVAGTPVLVVQGRNDRFGVPEPAPGRAVVVLEGDHGLKRDLDGVRGAVAEWLERVASVRRSGRRESNPP